MCFSFNFIFKQFFLYFFLFIFFLLILLRSRMIWLRLHVMFDHLLIIRYNQTTQTKIQTYISNKQTNNQKHIQNHNLTLKPQNQNKQNQKKKQSTKRFYQKYLELRRRINAHSYPVLPATLNTGIIGVNSTYTIAPTTSTATTTNNFTVQRSASLKDYKPLRYEYTQFGIHDNNDCQTAFSFCLSFHFYYCFGQISLLIFRFTFYYSVVLISI